MGLMRLDQMERPSPPRIHALLVLSCGARGLRVDGASWPGVNPRRVFASRKGCALVSDQEFPFQVRFHSTASLARLSKPVARDSSRTARRSQIKYGGTRGPSRCLTGLFGRACGTLPPHLIRLSVAARPPSRRIRSSSESIQPMPENG